MTQLVIIDYGSGNLRSVAKACERALLDHSISGEVIVSDDPATLHHASHILLPGVGAFGDCMQGLTSIDGLLATLTEQVLEKRRWFLGICVGMQLLFDKGYEHGEHAGLGWIGGEVKRFATDGLKVPHMGWNRLSLNTPPGAGGIGSCSPLFHDIPNGAHAYFVHSYHAQGVADEHVIATTEYGGSVVAAVAKDNMFGAQFHPEKSQAAGLQLLANFLAL